MSVLTSRPVLRWLVPSAVAVAVLGGGVAIGLVTAAADSSVQPRSAQQLLIDLQSAKVDGLSGTIVARADLGLPQLPATDGVDLTTLLSGTHTLRVWYAKPDKARIALLGTLGETDVIANGTDVWTWSSRTNQATHRKLTAGDKAGMPGGRPDGMPSGLPTGLPSGLPSLGGMGGNFTPQQLASLALTFLGPTTNVTTGNPTTIAGRDAYELVLAPKDQTSLIGSIRLGIDATAHIPLRLQVFSRDSSSPAIEIAFTQISLTPPDAAEFTFNPPPGATVTEQGDDHSRPSAPNPAPTAAKPGHPGLGGVKTIGQGWTTVLVLPTKNALPAEWTNALPAVSGTWGKGHLLTSKLFTILITDDGRVLAGAVDPARIYAAAADPAGR
jgi:outer membrane lipoprotein-sorting protein